MTFSLQDYSILRKLFLEKHIAFTRYFFKCRDSVKFIVSPHHSVIANTIDEVIKGNITRLIVNVPPGYTKTEMVVQMLVARGLAINPAAKFIHTSYSQDLVLHNSSKIKDIVETPEFQYLYPMTFKKDSKAKGEWYTEHGGGLKATAAGGGITGFRAGLMAPGFTGAFIVDDPIKPDDANSLVKLTAINNRVTSTFASRLAVDTVPIIIIMQRVHENDMSGFLLKGGTGEHWHHLVLPAIIEEDYVYPVKDYPYGIEIAHNLNPGELWGYKKTFDTLRVMEKADPYTTAAQYMQNPTPLGGGIIKPDLWLKRYDSNVPPAFEYRILTGDTAQKTKENNDYSVLMAWGVWENKLYLLDIARGKWESPDLKRNFIDFWNKHNPSTAPTGRNRGAYIEDKASGTDLIQNIGRSESIPIFAVQRGTDKVSRVMDVIPYLASGKVYIPEDAPWVYDFTEELRKFSPLTLNTNNDDQVDAFCDGVMLTLGVAGKEVGSW